MLLTISWCKTAMKHLESYNCSVPNTLSIAREVCHGKLATVHHDVSNNIRFHFFRISTKHNECSNAKREEVLQS